MVGYGWPVMNAFLCRFLALAFVFCAAGARAQIVVTLQMNRAQYVVGEALPATVTITNHSGQDLIFQSDGRKNWLDFVVLSGGGMPASPNGRNTFGAVKIPVGQMMHRDVDLSRLFRMTEAGSFSVYAVIRLPGTKDREEFTSNRVLFSTSTARPYWSQKIGVRGSPDQTREYRILNFAGGRTSQLYVQLVDCRTGSPIQTYSLGEVLLFRKPQITVDRDQNLHVFYLVSPTLWAHSRVDSNGRFLGRELHQRGAEDPVMVTMSDGTVTVGGGTAYDPNANSGTGKVHNANERPDFLYK
jgi:hypothetical protein